MEGLQKEVDKINGMTEEVCTVFIYLTLSLFSGRPAGISYSCMKYQRIFAFTFSFSTAHLNLQEFDEYVVNKVNSLHDVKYLKVDEL